MSRRSAELERRVIELRVQNELLRELHRAPQERQEGQEHRVPE